MKIRIVITSDADVLVSNDTYSCGQIPSGIIPFTVENMVDLLTAYNAY